MKTDRTKYVKPYNSLSKMYQVILILTITMTTFGCGTKEKKDSIDESQNCNFRFQLKEESGNAYEYDSENGHLKKLINPFKKPVVYADTTFFFSKGSLCELMKLCQSYKITNYPKDFHPESNVISDMEPSYHIKITINKKTTEINWTKNTTHFKNEDAYKLHKVLNVIDSIILSSPEFKKLPKRQYDWL
jgi:hypothetical protein